MLSYICYIGDQFDPPGLLMLKIDDLKDFDVAVVEGFIEDAFELVPEVRIVDTSVDDITQIPVGVYEKEKVKKVAVHVISKKHILIERSDGKVLVCLTDDFSPADKTRAKGEARQLVRFLFDISRPSA